MNVFDLSAKLTLDTSEYEKGLSGAGKSASGFGGKLATAAKVGAAAVAAIGTAAVALAGSVAKSVNDFAQYGDNIDKMSQKMGMSAQAYQEWDAILQHSGTSIDAMSRGMVTLSKAAESNSEAFVRLGISQEEIATLNQEDLFARTIEGLQGMEEGTERTALAQELLGGSAKELGALLNTSAEETEAMRQRVHELGGVMSDEAVKAAAAYQDSLQDMKTVIGGAKNALLSEFLPAITSVVDGLTSIFAGEEGGIEKVQEGISNFISTLTERVPQFVETGAKLLSSLVQGIAQNMPAMVQALVDTIVATLPTLIQGAIQLVTGLVAALPEIITGLIEAIPDILMAIYEGFLPLIEQLGAIFSQAWEAIKGVFAPIGEWFTQRKEDVQNAFAAVDAWFTEKFTAAKDAVHTAWENIGNWFGDRWADVKGAFQAADGWFSEKFNSAKEAVHTSWSDIGSWFSDKWTEIQNVFSAAREIFSTIGGNIVEGVKDGIRAAWERFTGWVTERFTNLVNNVKSALGIASPSKVFASIGDFMVQGLGQGWDKNFGKVRGHIEDDLNFSGAASVSGVGRGAVRGAVPGAGTAEGNNAPETIIMQVVLDGKVIGETAYNYNRRRLRTAGA